MSLACRYTSSSRVITFLAALWLAVILGSAEASADAVAETGQVAADSSANIPAQDAILAYDRYLPDRLEPTMQADDSLFCWRETDNRDLVRLALSTSGTTNAPGDPVNSGTWSTDA